MPQCDGLYPCNRCREDNVICLFGERDKTQDKTWPRGTVELQQKALNIYEEAIIELYRRSLSGCPWDGPPVPQSGDGRPLIHAILATLGACKPNCSYFQEIKEKIGKVIDAEAPPKTFQPSLKREGDLDVKRESQDSWPHSIPASIQEHPRMPNSMAQATSHGASYPPSPPKESTQTSANTTKRASPSGSPVINQGQRSTRTSHLPAQITLPTPNPSPNTETTPQMTSSFGHFNYQNTTPQTPWPYGTNVSSSGSFPSYENTPILGGPALYDDGLSEVQSYGWPSTNPQISGEEQMLLAAMMDVPTQQNPYGFSDYPFAS